MPVPAEPPAGCALCPRLAAFRAENRRAHPDWHNSPVRSFGSARPELLIVGLAPGLKGANRTGRPFTGDYAGALLYPTLVRFGYARGTYGADPADGLALTGCRVTNAVRCVPPANRPTGPEAATCRRFLAAEIAATRPRAILALGAIAHDSVLAALGLRRNSRRFAHGAIHELADGRVLADSYHCSRYNLNTGRLTEAMFAAVFEGLRRRLSRRRGAAAPGRARRPPGSATQP
ncbi:MAG: uracil-DNA glycosylase [Proteobacteria bacterium]|nr:uracil-DNA glycosylase [Pseudomonadota bacterium]